jgi:hypothetical protein
MMLAAAARIFIIVAVALATSGCSSINTSLAAAMGDYTPEWAGGLPPGAPPRPGTPAYEEYLKKLEGKSGQPSPKPAQPAQPPAAQPSALY